ncbi:MAG TPA: 3D domain-containing protein [Candidatus Sumerlaeota bacterium]|nr:3D domain-containing protein [Candidatus Sumerlaeota bacterium]
MKKQDTPIPPTRSGHFPRAKRFVFLLPLLAGLLSACASTGPIYRDMETTAYCPCGECNGYERGFPDFWNKYTTSGGQLVTADTASGEDFQVYHPGFFSTDSLVHPWMLPVRLVFFPWLFLPQDGTLAADTAYYPFGTRMYVPGYGWGVVQDRGRAIKGPNRLDLLMSSHGECNDWGRQRVRVEIEPNS